MEFRAWCESEEVRKLGECLRASAPGYPLSAKVAAALDVARLVGTSLAGDYLQLPNEIP